jgi:exosortase D (VPLPA-CTERM-specific)
MNRHSPFAIQTLTRPATVVAAVIFVYFSVLTKLGRDWWLDENYSHGLLIPFVIGFIIWSQRQRLLEAATEGSVRLGSAAISIALLLFAGGTFGAELFTQRISLVLMIAGLVAYFFGERVLAILAVPFTLFFLAIPIPQIVFNRIAFPLQIWASKMAVWGIRLFDVPAVRNGNVIDILPKGSTMPISLEVVEACSGIRSLSTLITLALVLAFITRNREAPLRFAGFSAPDLWRTILLMAATIPLAVLTNAGRVMATGVGTYLYGKPATEGSIHEASGFVVYVVATALLMLANQLLKKVFRADYLEKPVAGASRIAAGRLLSVIPPVAAILIGGAAIIWFEAYGETTVPRAALADLPRTLGDWKQKGSEIRFDNGVESVLGATDYTLREYSGPDGRVANIYVGYYATQRTGATYHSPQNCLPGAGWVMHDLQNVNITTSDGRSFKANQYVIDNGVYREVMIYWYQGRGRREASEYTDKVNTVWDGITLRRTDGAMVRVMTDVGSDVSAASNAAAELAARLEEQLTPFVPE